MISKFSIENKIVSKIHVQHATLPCLDQMKSHFSFSDLADLNWDISCVFFARNNSVNFRLMDLAEFYAVASSVGYILNQTMENYIVFGLVLY